MSEGGGQRVVFGIRPVEELCRALPREIAIIYVADGYRSPEIDQLIAAARDRAVPVEMRPRQLVADLAGSGVHQGVLAIAGAYRYRELGELLNAVPAAEPALLLLLDGVTDPHNLGALVRSTEVMGGHGVVIPDRRAAPVTPTVVKASAGATERLAIAQVSNLLRTVDGLRERGIQVLGASGGQGTPIDEVDLLRPTALVIGAEGRGLREAMARRCDGLVQIPQRGQISSLNASVAGAILLYEAARQRRAVARNASTA